MADMSDVLNVLTSIENYLIDLPTKILLKADQIFIVNGLSDVSENLGIVTAGEFRAGNRNEPGMFLRTAVAGSGFSGMRMRYPAMSYDLDGVMTDWNLVGINDDILQFGVRASDGKLVAGGGAVILDSTGITAVGGTIAGWTIDTTELTNTKIKISSAGSIESIPFVSGIGGSGWKISEDGDVEFNNAVVRGELRTTVLTYQEVQAVSGTMGVFQSAGVLSSDLTLPAVPSGTYQINTKSPNSTNPQIFDNNHILQIKNGTQSSWFIIDGGFGTGGDGYYWLCTYLSGTTDVTYTTGQAVISYGVSGDGFLLMEAIGTGAPYFSVRTHAGAPYTANTEHVRMGNLDGNWGYSSAVYGVAMGQYASGKGNITIDPTDGIKINVYNTNVMQFTSTGSFITNVLNIKGDDAAIAIGATPPTGSTSGTGLWLSKAGLFALDTDAYQVKIDATDGKFYAGGGVVVLDEGGISISSFYGTTYNSENAVKWITSTKTVASIIGTHFLLSERLSIEVGSASTYNRVLSLSVGEDAASDNYAEINMSALSWSGTPLSSIVVQAKKVIISGGTSSYSYITADEGEASISIQYDTQLRVVSNQVRVLDGSVSIPGIGFINDINTGIYRASSDQLGITTGGTERVRIAAGLYVGRGADAGSGNIAYTGNLKSYKNSTEYTGYIFVPLTTPLTSTSWDGDSFSTTAKTKIDLSAVFGVPAGIKAVLCICSIRDSASATNEIILLLSPNNTANQGLYIGAGGLANDKYGRGALTVPCDSNGDIYYQIYASGTGTADVWLEIYGYFI